MIKNLRLPLCLLLAFVLCLLLGPHQAQTKTLESDRAENLFFYANDTAGKRVLLKVIPLDTLKGMARGRDGTPDSTYYGSFIDRYPTPTYCEGRGVTIEQLLEYVRSETSVNGAQNLTYQGDDRLYFYSCDGPTSPVNHTYNDLLGVDRYYFPQLYNYWDAENTQISDVNAVLAEKDPMPVYLATESNGGRVFFNLAEYIAANNGSVSGCMTNMLDDSESLRLLIPQTENTIRNSEPTFSTARKWVYKIWIKPSGASPIVSLGDVPDPACTFTLSGDTLTITMSCSDPKASIYYSTIGGITKTPVNLYSGPITVKNYDPNKPFELGLTAVREGYANDADPIVYFDSSHIGDPADASSFVYSISSGTKDIETGTPFTVSATLTADRDCTLYGAEYRLSIPAAYFTAGSVSAGNGWEYGTATVDGDTVVTFIYLDTEGQAIKAGVPVDLGSISLTPLQAGNASPSVMESIVTKENALSYGTVRAEDLELTVTANELAAAKTAAKNALDTYKNPADYRQAQRAELASAIIAGIAAIDAAADIDGVNNALLVAKAVMNNIKTDAQLTADEQAKALAEAKTAAKNTLANYKNPDDYRGAQKAELTAAINAGNSAIDAAADIDAVNSALAAAKAELDKIEKGGQVNRIAGGNRYDTSAKTALQAYPDGAKTVIIARGDDQGNFADALAASYLAGVEEAPILLTRPDSLPQEIEEAVQKLKAKKIYVLGGELAVSQAAVSKLKSLGLQVERIQGNNRYATAAAIAAKGGPAETAIVVSGFAPADSLVAGPLAFGKKHPILLVDKNNVPAETEKAIADLGIKKIIVIGGENAVSKGVYDELPAKERYSGQSRIETSLAVAKKSFTEAKDFSIVGYLKLADAVGAAISGNPIIYVKNDISDVDDYLTGAVQASTRFTIFGGPLAVSNTVENELKELLQ